MANRILTGWQIAVIDGALSDLKERLSDDPNGWRETALKSLDDLSDMFSKTCSVKVVYHD